jgi:hypothetical protein
MANIILSMIEGVGQAAHIPASCNVIPLQDSTTVVSHRKSAAGIFHQC